jgi:hypothetical protein
MNRPLPRAEASSITRIRIRPVRIWASMAAISARAAEFRNDEKQDGADSTADDSCPKTKP